MANKKQTDIFRNISMIPLVFLFQQSASAVGRFVADRFTYDTVDEYGLFAWVSVHHIMQMLLAIIAIVILAKILKLDFGFGFGDRKTGIEHVVSFTMAALVFALLWYFVRHLQGNMIIPDYPLSFSNIAGQLGFQAFLSGPSEEILFRALPITLLAYIFRGSKAVRVKELDISYEIIIAALLFALAHISWSVDPFSFSASWVQLMISFGCGIWYGIAYKESRSIIYPMVMHSAWNVVMVGARYVHLAFLA